MRKRDIIAAWAVLATVSVGVLAIGGSTRATALGIAAMGLACSLPYVRSRRSFERMPALLSLVVVATGATFIQIVPLPFSLVEILSPEKARLVYANAVALGDPKPTLVALSLETSAGWIALASFVGYLGVVSAAIRVSATSRGRRILARGLVALAVLVAVIGIFHQAAGARVLFGLYEPTQFRAPPRFLAPLMNPNHLAGFLAMATPIAIALAYASMGSKRFMWAAAAAVCGCVSLLLQSRTASVALIVGIAVVATLLLMQRRRDSRRPRDRANRVAAALIVVVAFAGALTYFGRGAATEISATSASELTGESGKLSVWKSSTTLLWEHKIVGVGRGAFEQAFTPRIHDSKFRHSHVENEALQSALDWGIPIALLLLALLLASFRRASKRATSTIIESGLFAALIVCAFHNSADFSIGLPGPALFALVAFAACSRAELVRAPSMYKLPPRVWRGALIAVGAMMIVGAATPLGQGPRADSKEVSKAYGTDAELNLALRAWRRHPADYISAGQAAASLARASDQRAFRVASRALAINPDHWQLHLTVARMLLQTTRPTQALGEYRLALEHAPTLVAIIKELTSRFPQPELALRGLPMREGRITQSAVALRSIGAYSIGLAWLRELQKSYPANGKVALWHARFASQKKLWSEAADAANLAFDLGEREGLRLAAASLLRSGLPNDAAALIEGGRSNPKLRPPKSGVAAAELRVLAQARLELGQLKLAAEAIERAIPLSRGTPAAATDHSYLADIQERMGLIHQAEKNRQTAGQLRGKSLNAAPPSGN